MFENKRQEMVEDLVVGKGVRDQKVIDAMLKVERHLFVTPEFQHQAYSAKSLPIGFGQTISHPTTVALMTERLQLTGSERVLEIGCGSGYQAAVLATIGAKVYSIERIAELARRAQALFDNLGYYTIGLRIGDGTLGWTQHAPYDRIIVTAASPAVPQPLVRQLAENGRLVLPVEDGDSKKMLIISRRNGQLTTTEENSRQFVPLIGKKGWKL